MAKNYAIFRAEKLKSHKDIVNVLKEQQRYEQYQSDRADPELEHLNEYSGSYQDAIDLYDFLLPDKVRKNAVVGLAFVVSASQEFDSRDAEESYYTMAREFISERFGTIVGWSIHRDETSTHMQVTTIPLDKSGKLNARALIGGDRHRMQRIQDEFYEQVGAPHQLDRGVSNPRTRHVSAEEFHRQTLKEDQERAENLDTRERALLQREDEAEAIVALSAAIQQQQEELEQQTEELAKQKDEFSWQQQFLEDAGLAAADMVELNNLERCDRPNLISTIKKLAQSFKTAFAKFEHIAKTPIETVAYWCEAAQMMGCKNLNEFLYGGRTEKDYTLHRPKPPRKDKEKKSGFHR